MDLRGLRSLMGWAGLRNLMDLIDLMGWVGLRNLMDLLVMTSQAHPFIDTTCNAMHASA